MMDKLEITVGGNTFPVAIDKKGLFCATATDGSQLCCATWAQLRERLSTIVKSKPANIRFIEIEEDCEGITFKEGVGLSIHSGNNNVMVRYGKKAPEQLSRWGTNNIYDLRINREKVKQLKADSNRAEKKLQDYLTRFWLDLYKAVSDKAGKEKSE
jgi:hypothetical protein